MKNPQRVVLITGAASGIGAAVCRLIAGDGTKLLIHARHNQAGLDTVAAAARKVGSDVATKLGDLTDPDVPVDLITAAIEAFGTVDQIVSNAGFAQRGVIDDNIENLARAERGMPEAFFRLANAAMPYLEKSDCGRVVAVSSLSPTSSPPTGCSPPPPPPRQRSKRWRRHWPSSLRHRARR